MKKELKELPQPTTPAEGIQSRRNPCYGCTAVIDIRNHENLWAFLTTLRNDILKIVDPDRDLKQKPIRSPLYIKNKFFHSSVFGIKPLIDKEQYTEIYTNEEGLLKKETIDKMCQTLQTHLDDEKPFLSPIKCELMPKDGVILARFKYNTKHAQDNTSLLALKKQLDPDQKFNQWGFTDGTVTVVLGAIDTNKISKESNLAIQELLVQASNALTKLGDIQVDQFKFISAYDKRTLSLKHVQEFVDIKSNNSYVKNN